MWVRYSTPIHIKLNHFSWYTWQINIPYFPIAIYELTPLLFYNFYSKFFFVLVTDGFTMAQTLASEFLPTGENVQTNESSYWRLFLLLLVYFLPWLRQLHCGNLLDDDSIKGIARVRLCRQFLLFFVGRERRKWRKWRKWRWKMLTFVVHAVDMMSVSCVWTNDLAFNALLSYHWNEVIESVLHTAFFSFFLIEQ